MSEGSFPKDAASESQDVLLTPLEQEILSVCLHSQQDPRDIGILPALISVERRGRRPRT